MVITRLVILLVFLHSLFSPFSFLNLTLRKHPLPPSLPPSLHPGDCACAFLPLPGCANFLLANAVVRNSCAATTCCTVAHQQHDRARKPKSGHDGRSHEGKEGVLPMLEEQDLPLLRRQPRQAQQRDW